jgi:hypothetical protein
MSASNMPFATGFRPAFTLVKRSIASFVTLLVFVAFTNDPLTPGS